MTFLYILLAIFAFGVMIAIHELGHFLMARAFGVGIYEFSIGMGPKLFSKSGKKSFEVTKRGELDGNKELMDFAAKLEKACIDTIESGKMTKDLVGLWEGDNAEALTTEEFIGAIRENLDKAMA